jgi:hypothetical protein
METRPVSITFPASPEYLRLARIATADAASRAGLDYEEIDDVRIAVSELFSVVSVDPEATVTVVNVSSAIAARDQTTIGAYRQQTAERVVSGLLSARLGELSQKPDAPFLAAGTNRSLFVSAAEMTSMTAVVPDTGIEKGLAALFAEADRMTKFGITETELDAPVSYEGLAAVGSGMGAAGLFEVV